LNLGKDVEARNEVSLEELNAIIISSIQEVKGHDILKLDLREIEEATTDSYIICHGESTTQVNAIASKIIKDVQSETGMKPTHIEGIANANWILVDYFDTVVHIFYKETREFYQIEELWSDAKFLKID